MPTVKVLLSKEQIAERVAELGKQISKHYADLKEPLVLVGVLKGSFVFLADLCREISIPVETEFIGVSSYGEATKSSGVVQLTQDLTRPIKGRAVLLVEDIVDTGLTAKYLLENFKTR
ncbi:MAG: hypoxanthine phosphoribosyltransferase, partial [Deltaproteobacteria bacterium]|nr:hypoxanthine phosphoribosyltransferase [Deltaproteobacteria bacterium]